MFFSLYREGKTMRADTNNMSHQVLMAVLLGLFEDEKMDLHDVIELCKDAATKVYFAWKRERRRKRMDNKARRMGVESLFSFLML